MAHILSSNFLALAVQHFPPGLPYNQGNRDFQLVALHRRYGHLGVQDDLQKLTPDNLVRGIDYKHSNDTTNFCEAYIKWKHKKSPFQVMDSDVLLSYLILFIVTYPVSSCSGGRMESLGNINSGNTSGKKEVARS